mmetsp:Transcript_34790/g.44373  ORF Transcript_34790/g.44373 Transcript_34790/m.44373 type:complete len:655 (+) Transcript_34790:208-2172(+)|eukprot:CAMPEP_0117751748 /NCGR_PEP_ID=MMETSP0947-20121206/11167_1 /TAXON_ID=44440 /ORGANISM="Chattonella subsalsa, Strain CCMP2191" /LENGTH=654 /DNA_ID=CAMNT_0005570203 /DNA_START=132 /DNA_END=2096 /DNA_ORIENTATION=-
MADDKKKAGGLNPNASSFSFNPAASNFTPTFMQPPPPAPRPPAPVSIGASPPAPVPVPAPAPVPVSLPSINDVPPEVTKGVASVNLESGNDEEIDENDPLWKVTLQLANGDRKEAMKMLEDPDTLMQRPEVMAVLSENGGLEEGGDSWEDLEEPPTVTEQAAAEEAPAATEETTPEPPAAAPKEEPEVKEEEAPTVDSIVESIEADPREHLNIVFIGHVDAGKSTLSGQILYCTDFVDRRTIEKYEREAKERNRESWFLAFIMDTNEEERSKGKTVEVGRAHFESENKRYTILDAPGHKSYVPNMISGAAQADVGILVISARRGEFETGFEKGGQTREHALLAKTLGVIKLIVVINKMDDSTVNWAKERYDECVTKLKPFLRTCGYAVKRDVQFIPISGLVGSNIKDVVDPAVCPWWQDIVASGEHNTTQPTLLSALDALEVGEHRNPEKAFIMPVLDRYHERGTIVLGKVDQGTVRSGQQIMIMPTRQLAKVEQVTINDVPVNGAKPGENVKIKVNAGVDEVLKGFVLCDSVHPCRAVTSFIVQLALIETLPERPLYTAGYPCVLHTHTVETECVCTELLCVIDKKTGKKKRQPHATKGSMLECILTVEQSICIETYKRLPSLGRFTLRDSGKEQGITIGIGKVLKLIVPKKK